ncbi:RNA methyltransferase, TrmH family protein [unidentified eubacterium SCB49]|nr:RNA methyltransferase, TrmH family protein [unidentified eubacterium SCB49]
MLKNYLIKFGTVKNKLILISKSQIKLITSLSKKKYREQHGFFIAEGPKVIDEFIAEGLELHFHFTTEIVANETHVYHQVTSGELKKISKLTNPNTSLAVFKIPKKNAAITKGVRVVLDGVQDPGNLGTIIRLCDWFGVSQLICSKDTVDCFNPKVVQATMGSLARVVISYVDIKSLLQETTLPIYGGVLEGVSLYSEKIEEDSYLVVGNEGNGISEEIIAILTHKITIPQYGASQKTESLNVATATAILLSEVMRTTGK